MIRNEKVYNYRMAVIYKISTEGLDWQVFRDVPYNKMLTKFWRPFDSFFPPEYRPKSGAEVNYLANIHRGENISLMGSVCPECPWRKKDSTVRHHPAMPKKVMAIAKGDKTLMACHMSQKTISAGPGQHGIRRCRGIATFRSNMGIDSEVLPDPATVFANEKEAFNTWPKNPYQDWEQVRNNFFKQYPWGHYLDENENWWIAGKLAPDHDDVCIARCQDSVTK